MAPATEYVVIPPASLSTLPVMIPGPNMAKKMAICLMSFLKLNFDPGMISAFIFY
jgi:hypothetical protein